MNKDYKKCQTCERIFPIGQVLYFKDSLDNIYYICNKCLEKMKEEMKETWKSKVIEK